MARLFKMLQVDEDLNNLAQILRGQSLSEGIADLAGEKLVQSLADQHIPSYRAAKRTHLFHCLVNDTRVRKIITGKKVKLVQEVSDVDATQWIHL